MLWLGESVLSRNRIKDIKEILANVSKITPADVARVANAVLDSQHLKLSVVGPITDAQNTSLSRLLGV
jgi:predicted Zn-dependent peptidase